MVQLLVLLGILSLLFIPMPSPTLLWNSLNNFAHLPLFALVMILLVKVSRTWNLFPQGKVGRQYRFAWIGAVVLACITEGLQSFSETRHFEYSDIVQNLLGAMCGLGFLLTYDEHLSGKWARWRQFPQSTLMRLGIFIIIVNALVPTLVWAYAYWDRAKRFPKILEFSTNLEMKFVKSVDSKLGVGHPPDGWKKLSEDQVGKVIFYPKTYPRIRLDDPFPDWRGFTYFSLYIFSTLSKPQPIVIQIVDNHYQKKSSDQYNKAFTILPGLNQIRIPLEDIRRAPKAREMDMSAIKRIMFYARKPRESFVLYIDDLRLE